MSKIKDNYKKLMDDHGIEWEEGHHTEEKILDADEVIKSPGIPKEAPMIQKLMARVLLSSAKLNLQADIQMPR